MGQPVSSENFSRRDEHHAWVLTDRQPRNQLRFYGFAGELSEFVGDAVRLLMLERFVQQGQHRKPVPGSQVKHNLVP